MKYKQLVDFVARHGNVSIVDTAGKGRTVMDPGPDVEELMERANGYLWDGYWRSRDEMEALIAQSERGLRPGCVDCDRLEKALIEARDQDRKEGNMEGRHELPTLHAFQDHRQTHQ